MATVLDEWYSGAVWAQHEGCHIDEYSSLHRWGAIFVEETIENLLRIRFPYELLEVEPEQSPLWVPRDIFLVSEGGTITAKTGDCFAGKVLKIRNPLESYLEWLAFSLENSTFVEGPVSFPQWMDTAVWIPHGVDFSGEFAPYCGIPNDLPYLWLVVERDLLEAERVLYEWFPEGRFEQILRLFERWLAIAKYPPAWSG
jgi:hypothetical protein